VAGARSDGDSLGSLAPPGPNNVPRPDSYFLLKWVHVLSSTLLFGTGLGTAFHGWMAMRSRNLPAMAVSGRNVVLADWIFTTPAVIIQPVTGLVLAGRAGYGLGDSWLLASVILYLLVGACWLPVVWLQIRLRRLAEAAAAEGSALPPLFDRYAWIWFSLGWPAFIGVIAIFWLMIAKPVLW
jgi:uncharacterized membrane protein